MFAKRSKPTGGLHPEITLPHKDEWELYHNSLSLCSRKLRVCLDELGFAYTGHHIELIETGSYDTCKPWFLNINPAGTVPVVLHEGHPVYESHDQIVYLAQRAGERGAALLGLDESDRAEIARWNDVASLVGDPVEGSDQRAGHCLPGLTLPLFAAMVQYVPYREIFKGFLTHPDRKRPATFLMMRLKGQEGLASVKPLRAIVDRCRADFGTHLDQLESQLGRHDGPWIIGDNLTLADISWVALLDRAREAGWEDFYWGSGQRPLVEAYWQRWTLRASYQTQIDALRCDITRRGIADVRRVRAENASYRRFLEGSSDE